MAGQNLLMAAINGGLLLTKGPAPSPGARGFADQQRADSRITKNAMSFFDASTTKHR
jgi:hypothetical protein